MTTLAISAPQPNVGTITSAGLMRISSLLAGSMIWVKSTAARLVAVPLAAQAGADLSSQPGSLFCRIGRAPGPPRSCRHGRAVSPQHRQAPRPARPQDQSRRAGHVERVTLSDG